MSTEDKQKEKGFFAKICEFFNGFGGPGCACNCLKTAWEKQTQEEANKENQGKSESQKVSRFELWARRITGIIFLLIGIYFTIAYTLGIRGS